MQKQFFTIYTTERPVSFSYPFHIAFARVTNSNEDFVSKVNRMHSHEFMQILFVTKGEITSEVEGFEESIFEGEISLIPPLVKHRNRYLEGAELYTISFTPAFIDTSYESHFELSNSGSFQDNYFIPYYEMLRDHELIRKIRFLPSDIITIKNLISEIDALYNHKDKISKIRIHANFLNILAVIARTYIFNKEVSEVKRTPLAKHYDKVNEAVVYVKENYFKEINIDDLIDASHLSGTYFRRIFKDITGKPFQKYLTELRIYNAVILIKISSKNLSEIAYEVGFEEFLNFYRAFKRVMGCSPSQYRKQ